MSETSIDNLVDASAVRAAIGIVIALLCTACGPTFPELTSPGLTSPGSANIAPTRLPIFEFASQPDPTSRPRAGTDGVLAELRFLNQLHHVSAKTLRQMRQTLEREYEKQPSTHRRLRLALLLGEPRLERAHSRRAATMRAQVLGEIAREDPARARMLGELFAWVQNERRARRQHQGALHAARVEVARLKYQRVEDERSRAQLEQKWLRERNQRQSMENTVNALKDIENHMRTRERDPTRGSAR